MVDTENIGYLIHHLAFMLDGQSEQALQERLRIGFSQFKILMCLSQSSSGQQRHIAKNLGQTEASVSRQIKLLQDRGLILNKVNPASRRERTTVLTDKGEKLVAEALEILNRTHQPVFESLTDAQIASLQEVMVTMHGVACRGDKGCNYR